MIWPCVSPRNMGILIFIIDCFSVGDSTASQTACSKHKDQKGKAREYHQIGNLDSSFGTFLSVFFLNVLQSYCIDNQETESVKSGHCCQAEPFSRPENAKLLRRHIHQAGRFLRGKSALCYGVCQYLPHENETRSMTWWNYSLIEAWHHDEITC